MCAACAAAVRMARCCVSAACADAGAADAPVNIVVGVLTVPVRVALWLLERAVAGSLGESVRRSKP